MATLDKQVAASADDCDRGLSGNNYNRTSAVQRAGARSVNYKFGGGMRFLNITIPRGSTIVAAHLTFTGSEADSGVVVNTRISAEDVDTAAAMPATGAAFDTRFSGHTTARIDWDAIPAWTVDTEYQSPEIKTVIQEIVDRPGWISGNNIVIFWEDFDARSTKAADCERRGYSYDASPAKAPELHIEYSVPAVAGRSQGHIIG